MCRDSHNPHSPRFEWRPQATLPSDGLVHGWFIEVALRMNPEIAQPIVGEAANDIALGAVTPGYGKRSQDESPHRSTVGFQARPCQARRLQRLQENFKEKHTAFSRQYYLLDGMVRCWPKGQNRGRDSCIPYLEGKLPLLGAIAGPGTADACRRAKND
jgi:hypothetical protein